MSAQAGAGWAAGPRGGITDVRGIRVGHWTDRRGATGCTVILCPEGAVAAVDLRGGAPGSRETDVLGQANLVRTAHAIVLAGGSAFGLAAADGVMRWLAERGHGFGTQRRSVPIVPAAVIYDLGLGSDQAAPDGDAGYAAASRAGGGKVAEGSVGAGTGATVAKLLGPDHALKGGIGTASLVGPNGAVVAAIAVTNAVGTIVNPATGETLAGVRGDGGSFLPLYEVLELRPAMADPLRANTTLVCVATSAKLDHRHVQRLATQAHDGMARAILPAHTMGDGDIAFALATGDVEIEDRRVLDLGVLTVLAVEQAILRSVVSARGLKGIPSATEWRASDGPAWR